MAHEINRLTDRKVKAAKEPGLIADGGGLYLQISKSGSKSWLFRFSLNNRAREMGLGGYRTVSLAEARDEALANRKLLREGLDPIEVRKARRLSDKAAQRKATTFKQCTEQFLVANESSWKNSKHRQQWGNTLKTYADPHFGDLDVAAVNTTLVLAALEPIWTTKAETASRLRGRIERVLDFATVRGHRTGENPARWRGHLDQVLPKSSRVKTVVHHPALPYDRMYEFMSKLRRREEVSARALEFLILTAARTTECLEVTREEIDMQEAIWTVPKERMKSKAEHRVPLVPAALEVIRSMPVIDNSLYVFPGQRPRRPLSNMAFLKLLERIGYGQFTSHGFRSSFRDYVADRTNFAPELAEMCLAHVVGNAASRAYRRSDVLAKRRKVMEAWASYISNPPRSSENVVKLRAELT
ncbi:integrase arm-type DNA-binding domain-containing protein [Pelagibius sp. Alg239-R121]|uniref:tyrosine-type recombinase/integrase n=1 Tax=Pelagibius sp. Alg239-R121 TaxID=2993448 RepID=UPI0024A71979|nr:integrase arm-type DNA-binding domain-containing protein [Pelagibius sp. Alg239-R121]